MGYGDRAPLLPQQNQFKPFGLFWNIVKSFAGAGTFALPWAVMNAGLIGGMVGIILIALLSFYTIQTLLKCGEKVMERNNKKNIAEEPETPPTYPQIGRAAYGEPGAKIVSLFSALMCFGVCLAYFALIAQNIGALFPKSDHIQPIYIILAVLPFTVFLSCLTDLSKLAYSSIAGSVALLVAMGAVCIYGLATDKLSKFHEVSYLEWKTLPTFLGGAAFLFIDHVILVPLANSCGNYRRFPHVLALAMVFVTIINIIFSGLSYSFWQVGTCGNVIGNLPDFSAVGDVVRIGISLEVLASFPLVANGGFQSLETGFNMERLRAFPYLAQGAPHPFFSKNLYYYLFRGGLITALAIVASFVGQAFGSLITLIGSLTIASTGFVFPQLFYMKLYRGELMKWDVIVQWLIVVFGIGMTILGTYQAVEGIIESFQPSNSTVCS